MPNWPSIEAFVDGVVAQTFGEPVVYQPMQAGAPASAPVPLTAIRCTRERMEAGAVASVEKIEVNPVDLPDAPPQRGDTVTAWGATFTVTTVRQPDPYGMVHLTLTMQP